MSLSIIKKPFIIIAITTLALLMALLSIYHYYRIYKKPLMCRGEISTTINNGQNSIVESYIINFYLGEKGKGSMALHGIYIDINKSSNVLERTLTFDYNWNGNYLIMKNICMFKSSADTSPDNATPFSKNEVVRLEMLTDKVYLINAFRPTFACNVR
ncbi:hypothetical protein [Lonsdalea quercina]|uniref:hypothetical protein n=1 Tax=Lonsdalea quercina TaxID=71657 RepID=UPI0039759380